MALVFQSSFEFSDWSDWVNGTPYGPPDTADNHIVSGWGCNYGPAYTCSNNIQEKVFGTPFTIGDIPPTYLQSTTRFRVAIAPMGATLPAFDFTSIGAMNLIGWFCANADGSLSGSDQSAAYLNVATDGRLELVIQDVSTLHYYVSAAAAYPVNALMHGIQVLLDYPDTSTLNFTVVVDNVTVLTGTQTATSGYWFVDSGLGAGEDATGIQVPRAGINGLDLRSNRQFGVMATAISDIEVEDSASIIDYHGCLTETLDITLLCSPFVPPQPPVINTYPMRCVRRFMLPYNENKWLFINRLEFVMQSGVGLATGQGSDPVVMVRLSKDGGFTWGPELMLSVGAMGQYAWRVFTTRLGRARNPVVEVSCSDPTPFYYLSCSVEMDAGTS